MVIPGDGQEYIESACYSSHPKGHSNRLVASDFHCHITEKRVHWMASAYRIPEKVSPLVPRRNDVVTNPPLEYCSISVDQLMVGFFFLLLFFVD